MTKNIIFIIAALCSLQARADVQPTERDTVHRTYRYDDTELLQPLQPLYLDGVVVPARGNGNWFVSIAGGATAFLGTPLGCEDLFGRLKPSYSVVRGWYFDRAVKRFIDTHPRPVVVNVGCGLDTRFQRIGGGKAIFYDMDLPEVIALRRELIPEQPGNVYIAASLLETDWMDDLRRRHPDGAFIFVVEGVLMYFYEKQVKSFLHHVANRFGGGELWFDVCGTIMSRHGVKPDSLRKHEAQIRSGISNGYVVEQWEPSLKLIEQANYMKFFRSRWGFFFGQILGRIPWLCYKFSSLLGYKITSK